MSGEMYCEGGQMPGGIYSIVREAEVRRDGIRRKQEGERARKEEGSRERKEGHAMGRGITVGT